MSNDGKARPSDPLAGKVALVTGGSNGIGAGVVRRLARHDMKVVIADVDQDAGEALAREVSGSFVKCNVASLDDNRAAVGRAREMYGGLDIVHLNAGVVTGCTIEQLDVSEYRRAMGVNLDGVVYGFHAALPSLRERGGGTVVITASMAGLVPVPLEPLYAANKHAVVGLTRSLGQAYASSGIKVHALCPSFADTAILRGAKPVLEQMGFIVLDVEAVVDAFMQVLDSEGTGECWFVVPGRPSEPFRFRNAPGPRARA